MSLAAGLPFDISSTGIEARLICSACHYLLVEPKFTSCGHRYCSVCLKKIITSEGPTSCRVTNCNQIISKDGIYPDLAMENELKHLTGLVCHNKAHGCSWNGHYTTYKNHLEQCTFEHLQCDYCSTSFTNRLLYEEHTRLCPKALVACPLSPFGCVTQIRREALADHVISSSVEHLQYIAERLLSMVQRSSGNDHPAGHPSVPVEFAKQSQQIEQLRLEQKSLQTILNKREQDLTRTRVDLQLYKGELCQLRKDLELAQSLAHHDGTYLWRIDNVQQLFHNAKNSSQASCILSAPFYTSKFGYKLALKVYLNGDKTVRNTHLSIYVTVMRGQYDSVLQWPFPYPITLCLYDRSAHQDHVVHTFTPDLTSDCFQQPRMDANRSSGIPEFCPLCKVFNKEFGYVNENNIFIKAFVDFKIYPTKIWPTWTKLQFAGLPDHVEHMKLKTLLDHQK